jgi:tetratricopeptide (TPR) repeat protein
MNFSVRSTFHFALSFLLFSIVISSCNGSKTSEKTEEAKRKQREVIRDLESKMRTSSSINNSVGKTVVQEYIRYATTYPDDSVAANYLFKGGEVAAAIGDYPEALHAYEQITTRYPTFRYVRESLYLQGFLLDNYLNDDAKAKTIYEKFLSTYTSGAYVEDAKAAIANLGKSDEELMMQIKKMNGEK